MDTKSKDKFYFSHDSNARRDPKLIALRGNHGWAGYGRFFALVEILRETGEYKIDITKKYVIQSVAAELDFDSVEDANNFIKDCLDFELLETDSIFVWSNSLNKRMQKFEEKRERYREMARKRWNGEKKEKNDSKKSKGTEEKGEKKKPAHKSIECLRDVNKFREVIFSKIRENKDFDVLNDKLIYDQRKVAYDWLKSTGKTYKDYKAFFSNWLRRNIKDSGTKGKGSSSKEEMVY